MHKNPQSTMQLNIQTEPFEAAVILGLNDLTIQ